MIKIEPPGKGDDSRHYGPWLRAKSGKVKSGYFISVNRGKESIALDLKSDADRKVFEALLSKADVLIENYRGGTMEKLGYGYDAFEGQISAADLRPRCRASVTPGLTPSVPLTT